MKTIVTLLPGIRTIGWVDNSKLPPNAALHMIVGSPFPVLTAVHPVPFFGEPECSCRAEKVNGQRIYEASLHFVTDADLPDSNLGFVVTDVSGNSFLIGGAEAPFPQVAPNRRLGTPAGDSAGVVVEVSHKSLGTLIPCVVSYSEFT